MITSIVLDRAEGALRAKVTTQKPGRVPCLVDVGTEGEQIRGYRQGLVADSYFVTDPDQIENLVNILLKA